MLSDFFLFIDTHSKICLSDRTLQNAKVGECFQVEGNCVCKTDTDWFSKCQAVILSNKSHNHNRRRSLSSSCWKEIFEKKKMFHLVSCSARVHKFWRFPGSCFHNDRYDLSILDSLNCVAWEKKKKNQQKPWLATEKGVHSGVLDVLQLSPGCQATAMLTIDSCANVWAPWMAVRVYKTHFSLCENDRMQWVKTTKLSQTAVCADNYQIYLLTTIRQNHFMKSIVWRRRMSPPSDGTDNSDNTPRTYTDKLLSIS